VQLQDPEFVQKVYDHNHSPSHPFRGARGTVTREHATQRLRELGFPNFNGGNGQPTPVPQQLLADALGWEVEFAVGTGKGARSLGFPSNYKLDIACPTLMVGIEVDGISHQYSAVKEKDVKKQRFLETRGWRVLHVTNVEVLKDLETTVMKVLQFAHSTT
jgi:hypothetical protein